MLNLTSTRLNDLESEPSSNPGSWISEYIRVTNEGQMRSSEIRSSEMRSSEVKTDKTYSR